MKLMCPEKRLSKLLFPFLLISLMFSMSIQAQRKKAAVSKKADVKKTQAKAKDAKKDSAKAKASAKNAKKDAKNSKASAKDEKKDKKEKLTAKETAKEKAKQKNAKQDPKKIAAARKAEAERRQAEEARRQAALAEQRRREQAAREARARKLAFERGLRTETVANIQNDKTDGEDLTIRRAAVDALGSHAGTIVVMEAQTGKIVTMVNQNWAIGIPTPQ